VLIGADTVTTAPAAPPTMLGRAIAGMRFLSFGVGPVGALLYTPAIVSRRDLPAESAAVYPH